MHRWVLALALTGGLTTVEGCARGCYEDVCFSYTLVTVNPETTSFAPGDYTVEIRHDGGDWIVQCVVVEAESTRCRSDMIDYSRSDMVAHASTTGFAFHIPWGTATAGPDPVTLTVTGPDGESATSTAALDYYDPQPETCGECRVAEAEMVLDLQ